MLVQGQAAGGVEADTGFIQQQQGSANARAISTRRYGDRR